MAEYKAIRGHTIRTIAGDASPLNIGDIWYNSTLGKIRGAKRAAGSWASGGNLNQTRGSNWGFGASETSALTSGGAHENPGGTPATQKTETYDGSSWTEVGDTNTGKQVASGFGTQTSGIGAGGGDNEGSQIAAVESWNGSAWTEVGDLNTLRGYAGGAGTTNTSGIVFGGYSTPPAANHDQSESWDGTSWTETHDLNVLHRSGGSSKHAPATSTLFFGGDSGPAGAATTVIDICESYDGSSWTEVGDLSTARRAIMGGGTSNTLALAFGGQDGDHPSVTGKTETWDGTSWTELADMSGARQWASSNGTAYNALVAGGETPGYFNTTEEWTQELAAVTFTSS